MEKVSLLLPVASPVLPPPALTLALALALSLGAAACSENVSGPAADAAADLGPQQDLSQLTDEGPEDSARPDSRGADAGLPDAAAADHGAAPTLWAVAVGGSDTEHVNIGIELDPADNSYVAGTFKSSAVSFGSTTLTLAPGTRDSNGMLGKLDKDGNWIWATSIDARGYLFLGTLALDSGANSTVSGYFDDVVSFGTLTLSTSGTYELFLARADKDGSWIWATSSASKGGSGSLATIVTNALDSKGNSYVTGQMTGTVGFGSTTLTADGKYIFVAKLDSKGRWEWARLLPGSDKQKLYTAHGVAVDSKDNLLVTGAFEGSLSFGTTTLTAAHLETFVARMDSAGSWQWARAAKGSTEASPSALVVDSADGAVLTGCFSGATRFGATTLTSTGSSTDVFVARVDSAGSWQWAVSVPSPSSSCGLGITADGKDNSYVVGSFFGSAGAKATFGTLTLTTRSARELFVAKLSKGGKWLDVVTAQGTSDKYAGDIALNSEGICHVTGGFVGGATFGTTPLSSAGDFDVFVWQVQL